MATNWAYLLCCRDGTFYAGWTNDLERRLQAHNQGTGAKYTRGRCPVRLVWAQSYPTKSEAMVQEARLKKMNRKEKQTLVSSWNGLADGVGKAGLAQALER